MEIGNDGIRIHGWQFCLIIGVIALLIIASTIDHTIQRTIDLEKAKISESEKTHRGHWLWGTKSEDKLQETKIIENEKSNRGHWLWGHWDDIAEKTTPSSPLAPDHKIPSTDQN